MEVSSFYTWSFSGKKQNQTSFVLIGELRGFLVSVCSNPKAKFERSVNSSSHFCFLSCSSPSCLVIFFSSSQKKEEFFSNTQEPPCAKTIDGKTIADNHPLDGGESAVLDVIANSAPGRPENEPRKVIYLFFLSTLPPLSCCPHFARANMKTCDLRPCA